jgi:protoporphyrin/coproporphyrin ferrochelatase
MAKNWGVLLVNLGSPDSPSEIDVRTYLEEFLMDPFVIDIPFILRWALIHWLVLPKRPKETAKLYREIWTQNGSPLVTITQNLAEKVSSKLGIPVEIGMRYGNPNLRVGIENLLNQGVASIVAVPLYPQYAMSSTKTAIAKISEVLHGFSNPPEINVVPPFYSDSNYISALVESIETQLPETTDHLLFSYHGLPVRHLQKSDSTRTHCTRSPDCCETASPAHATCYRHQVFATTAAVISRLKSPPKNYSTSFQSRFGRDRWILPETEATVRNLAQSGVKHLAMVCPAFVADCLETLEEVNHGLRKIFLDSGGTEFTYIPCLNVSKAWVSALSQLILSSRLAA